MLLSLDLILVIVDVLVKSTRLTDLLLNLLVEILTIRAGRLELTSLFLQVALVLHADLDDLAELLLVSVLELVNLDPCLLLNLLPLLDVLTLQVLNHLLLVLVLVLLLEPLQGVLLLHLSLGLLLLKIKLLDVLLKLGLLLLFGPHELLFAPGVSKHLLAVLLLLDAQLLLVDAL